MSKTAWVIILIAGLAAGGGLFAVSEANYLLFHTLVEFFSITVAWTIFAVVWNTRRFLRDAGLVVLGISYLFVGVLDLVHTLSYHGLGVLPSATTNHATQLWIAGRGLEAGSLLGAGLILGRAQTRRIAWLSAAIFAAVTGAAILTIFTGVFPTAWEAGAEGGLTNFKILSEYVICLVLAGTAGLYLLKRSSLETKLLPLLVGSIGMTIAAELSFTLYQDVYGFMNFLGHALKLVSFYLVYLALIRTGLQNPYSILYRGLHEEQELNRKMQARLQQKDKYESLGAMAGGIAHDFNNLLLAIIGNAELTRDDLPPQSKGHDCLDEVTTAANAAAELTGKILAFAGKDRLRLQPVDLNTLIRNRLADWTDRWQQRPDFRLALSPSVLPVSGDPDRLAEVLESLISNAVEASEPTAASIEITTEMEELDAAGEQIDDLGQPLPQGTYVRLTLIDEGEGMDPEMNRKVFDPFYSTRFVGRGLGLAAARGIIHSHRGGIWLDSAPGHGTRIQILLPTVKSASPAVAAS
ncbi:MAG: MASE3 domain-containing protein [Planctomycetota bacterium]